MDNEISLFKFDIWFAAQVLIREKEIGKSLNKDEKLALKIEIPPPVELDFRMA